MTDSTPGRVYLGLRNIRRELKKYTVGTGGLAECFAEDLKLLKSELGRFPDAWADWAGDAVDPPGEPHWAR
jgi:hypothetical protein